MIHWQCWFRHEWRIHQVLIRSDNGIDFVLAWKQCDRCAASRIVRVEVMKFPMNCEPKRRVATMFACGQFSLGRVGIRPGSSKGTGA